MVFQALGGISMATSVGLGVRWGAVHGVLESVWVSMHRNGILSQKEV